MELSALVPTRFLTIISHFVILITILWSREENVISCLPWSYSQNEYNTKDRELIAGLSLGIIFAVFELIGFLSGVSMFSPVQALISIVAHCSASISLAFFVTDKWDCDFYWWVFGFCSTLPALTEAVLLIGVFVLKKTI